MKYSSNSVTSKLILLTFSLSCVMLWTPAKSQGCIAPIDLVFVVDSSGSILWADREGWTKVKDFIIAFTRRFRISQSQTRVGLTVYGNFAVRSPNDRRVNGTGFFFLDTFDDATNMENAISNLVYINLTTNTADGLNAAYSVLLEEDNGDRPNVRNVAIVITDGISNVRPEDVPVEARKLKAEATVAAVGVTPDSNYRELKEIATSQDFVFQVDDFGAMNASLDNITDAVCKVVDVPSSQSPIPDLASSPTTVTGTQAANIVTPTQFSENLSKKALLGAVVGTVCSCGLLGFLIGLGIYLYKKGKKKISKASSEGNAGMHTYENVVISTVTGQQTQGEENHSYEPLRDNYHYYKQLQKTH